MHGSKRLNVAVKSKKRKKKEKAELVGMQRRNFKMENIIYIFALEKLLECERSINSRKNYK